MSSRTLPPDDSPGESGTELLFESLHRLPMIEVIALRSHAQDICYVDALCREFESALASQYAKDDKPDPEILIPLRGLSRFWLFGLYEFLRTWSQLTTLILSVNKTALARKRKGESASDIQIAVFQIVERTKPKGPGLLFNDPALVSRLKQVADGDHGVVRAVEEAKRRLGPIFSDVEAARVKLAKHAMPRQPDSQLFDAGYVRIERVTGSLFFFSDKADGSQSVLTRQNIASDLAQMWGDGAADLD